MYLRPQVADARSSSCDPFCHFIPIQFVLSWLGGVPFGNGLVPRTCVHFMDACKQDCGGKNGLGCFVNTILASHARGCMRKLVCFWEVRDAVVGLWGCMKQVRWKNCCAWLKVYRFRFLGKENLVTLNAGRRQRHWEDWLSWKVFCNRCTGAFSYGSSGKNGLPGMCSVLPPAANIGVLYCPATRTVISVFSHTLHNL